MQTSYRTCMNLYRLLDRQTAVPTAVSYNDSVIKTSTLIGVMRNRMAF